MSNSGHDGVGLTKSFSIGNCAKKKFSVMCCNINGFTNGKIRHLKASPQILSHDVLIIIEHKKQMSSELPSLPGFNLWAKNRPKEKGGGVAVYVRKRSHAWKMQLEIDEEFINEQLWIVIKLDKEHVVAVGGVYIRPQSYDNQRNAIRIDNLYGIRFLESLRETMQLIAQKGYPCIIMGDFNAVIPDMGCPSNPWGEYLRDVCSQERVIIWNEKPICQGKYTRIPEHNTAQSNILDYILSSNIKCAEMRIDEDRSLGIESDHVPLVATFEYPDTSQYDEVKKPEIVKWDYNVLSDWAQYAYIMSEIINEHPPPIFNDINAGTFAEQLYNWIVLVIRNTADRCFQRKIYHKQKSFEPGYIRYLRNQLRILRRQRRRAQNAGDRRLIDHLANEIWTLRQRLKYELQLKQDYEVLKLAEKFDKHKNGSILHLYKYVAQKTGKSNEKFLLEDENGDAAIDNKSIDKLLHQQWDKIYTAKNSRSNHPLMLNSTKYQGL